MHPVILRRPGRVSYSDGLLLQSQAREEVRAGRVDGVLLLLEHFPVITAGRAGGRDNLLSSPKCLQQQGIEFVESNRGGNITCHNPGQLVGYPIFNLERWREDVHWYVKELEEVLIRAIAKNGISAGRKARYTGVWVGDCKIAAIGISVRNWISGHGFALNVSNELGIFSQTIPCGIVEFGVTSLHQLGMPVSLEEVTRQVADAFQERFDLAWDKNSGGTKSVVR